MRKLIIPVLITVQLLAPFSAIASSHSTTYYIDDNTGHTFLNFYSKIKILSTSIEGRGNSTANITSSNEATFFSYPYFTVSWDDNGQPQPPPGGPLTTTPPYVIVDGVCVTYFKVKIGYDDKNYCDISVSAPGPGDIGSLIGIHLKQCVGNISFSRAYYANLFPGGTPYADVKIDFKKG